MSEPAAPSQPELTIEQYEKLKPMMFIETRGKKLLFNVPNRMAAWRVQSLSTKEPITLKWLAEMSPDDVLFDVGANVGMYTIMAAGVCGVRVFAFEPESQNFALLNQNIAANRLDERVVAYPVAVMDTDKLDLLYLSAFESAGSCHSFGAEVGFNLQGRAAVFKQGSFAISIDGAIRSGAVPVPNHIKIDVDGFEHLVLAGADETLARPELKSLLIELNTNLPEHHAAFDVLADHGFEFDVDQMEAALRKKGSFAGVGEVVFRRVRAYTPVNVVSDAEIENPRTQAEKSGVTNYRRRFSLFVPTDGEVRGVLRHVIAKLEAAPILRDPFPYVVIDGIFPDDYYRRILQEFPAEESFISISETGRVSADAFKERGVVLFDDENLRRIASPRREFWESFARWLYSDLFIASVVNKFAEILDYRLQNICAGGTPLQVRSDALLVKDHTNYAITPHTDAPHRLVSFLFYMPADDSQKQYGTSFYRPKDKDLICWGDVHHQFEQFEKTGTMEFLPNRLVAFPKTERTFHGVERIQEEGIARNLVINNIRILNPIRH